MKTLQRRVAKQIMHSIRARALSLHLLLSDPGTGLKHSKQGSTLISQGLCTTTLCIVDGAKINKVVVPGLCATTSFIIVPSLEVICLNIFTA